MSTDVVILGCGPAGLLTAHAARLSGLRPIIISVKRPSFLFGCQYLHGEIEGITLHPAGEWVNYELRGEVGAYANKVYGPEKPRNVSPGSLARRHLAWDIRRAYKKLWERYESEIVDERVSPRDVPQIQSHYGPKHFVSTIPAPLLCKNPMHDFRSVKCWAVGDAPELGQCAPPLAPEFTVVCDATSEVGWYRASNVFGYKTVEWPGWRSRPPISGVVEFLKPLQTDCDCWPEVHRRGRMGKWTKGVLAHDAFGESLELFEE